MNAHVPPPTEEIPPPEPKIRLTSLATIIDEPEEPIEWVWTERHQVAPGRPNILAAYGGLGKTWQVLAMALSVSTGIEYLGAAPAKTGRAIVLSYETGRRRLKRRLRRLVRGYGIGGDFSKLEFCAQEDLDVYLNSDESEEEITKLCQGVTLLVVDALLQGSPGLRENDAEISKPLHMLGRVSARTGCAIVVIHHERKSNDETSGSPRGESLRGHSSLHGACDAIWGMRAIAGGWVALRPLKTADGSPPQGWDVQVLDVEAGGVVINFRDEPKQATSEEGGQLDDVKDKILAHLKKHGPSPSKNSLSERIGGRKSTFCAALEELVGQGEIVLTDNGKGRGESIALSESKGAL